MNHTPHTQPLPLQGIRVLDVSQVMAGPFACMLLADLAPASSGLSGERRGKTF